MPVGAIISALGSIGGSLINSNSQEQTNDAQLAYAKWLYERQSKDNLAFWDKQNAYNSPQSQMQRFQQAGLNPNLIYGQGNSGPASPISTPDASAPRLESPQWGNAIEGSLGKLGAMYDLRIKSAQANNLEAQADVIHQDALLKAAQTDQVKSSTDRSRFDLNFETGLTEISAEARRESLRKTSTEANSILSHNRWAEEKHYAEMDQIITRISKEREETANTIEERQRIREATHVLKQQSTLNAINIALQRKGIMPHDPMYARFVASMYDKILDAIK